MNDYWLWFKIKTRPLGLHRIRRRDGFVIVMMVFCDRAAPIICGRSPDQRHRIRLRCSVTVSPGQ